MKNKLRFYIRKLLKENFFKEADLTQHYTEMLNNRVQNSIPMSSEYHTSSEKIPPSVMTKVVDIINIVQKLDFPINESYAIKIMNLPKAYKHLDLTPNGQTKIDKNTGRVKESRGNTIWILIRENEIKTIFLRGSTQKDNIPQIQYYIKSPLKLMDYYSTKNISSNEEKINFNMTNFASFLKNGTINKVFPKVRISNGIWFIDKENERLFQKSKSSDKETDSIENYETTLSDDDLMKVWAALEIETLNETFFE